MHIGNSGNQSPLSLLGDSFRSDHDPDAGNVSGRSNAPSSTGATPSAPADEEIALLQFEIDDQTAEDLAVAMDRIFGAEA